MLLCRALCPIRRRGPVLKIKCYSEVCAVEPHALNRPPGNRLWSLFRHLWSRRAHGNSGGATLRAGEAQAPLCSPRPGGHGAPGSGPVALERHGWRHCPAPVRPPRPSPLSLWEASPVLLAGAPPVSGRLGGAVGQVSPTPAFSPVVLSGSGDRAPHRALARGVPFCSSPPGFLSLE